MRNFGWDPVDELDDGGEFPVWAKALFVALLVAFAVSLSL